MLFPPPPSPPANAVVFALNKRLMTKRYGKILFQKVVLGYELPFVQNGSSENALKPRVLVCSPKLARLVDKLKGL